MINIVICDDEPEFLNSLETHIREYQNLHKVDFCLSRFTDGKKLINNYKLGYDIIFLDISMKELNGIETARKIRSVDKKVIIIFLTSIIKYALNGYALGAMNYIIKPVSYKKIETQLDQAINKYDEMEHQYITLKNSSGILKLYINDIIYIETHERNTMIHTSQKSIICFHNMKTLEKKLNTFSFIRCHSSYIVNIKYIDSIEKLLIILTTGIKIPISQQKRKETMKMIATYLGDEL